MKKLSLALILTLALLLCVGVASAERRVSETVGDYSISISGMECVAVGHWEITPTLLSVSLTDGGEPHIKSVSFTVSVYCQICDTTETYTRTENVISNIKCDEGFLGGLYVRISNAAEWYLEVTGPAFEHGWTDWMESEDGCGRICPRIGCRAKEVIPHTLNASLPCDELQTCSVCGAEVARGHDWEFRVFQHPTEDWPNGMVFYRCLTHRCNTRGEISCDSYTVDNYVPPTCYKFGKQSYTVVFTHDGKQYTISATIDDGNTPLPPHSYGSNGDGTHSCTNEGCTRAVNIPCTPGAAATCASAQTCTVCGGVLKPALPHQYEYHLTTHPGGERWPDGRISYVCLNRANCGTEGTVPCDTYTIDSETPPTCCYYGTRSYTATFTLDGQQYTYSNTTEWEAPTGQHSYGSNGDGTHSCTNEGCTLEVNIPCTPGAEATCTTPQTCTVCGGVLTATAGHTEVADPAVPASCTSTGLTEGSHCEECGETLREQQVIGLRVHWFGEWSPNGQGGHRASCWSCGASGTQPCTVVMLEEKPVCIVCGEYAGIELPVVEATATGKVATAGVLTVHHGEGVLTLAWVSGGNVMRPLGEVTVRVAMDDPGAVRLIGADGAEVPFTWADGWLTFTTDVASAWRLAE